MARPLSTREALRKARSAWPATTREARFIRARTYPMSPNWTVEEQRYGEALLRRLIVHPNWSYLAKITKAGAAGSVHCSRCGCKLSDPESVAAGIGPECMSKS